MSEFVIYCTYPGTHWWYDPWGNKEIAYSISDAVLVTATDRKYKYDNGYTVDDCTIYQSQDGREWAAIPPMDFGGSTGYLFLTNLKETKNVNRWWTRFASRRRLVWKDIPVTSSDQLEAIAESLEKFHDE